MNAKRFFAVVLVAAAVVLGVAAASVWLWQMLKVSHAI